MRHRAALGLVLVALLASCGSERWQGTGVVNQIYADESQVAIAHDDIDGLMSAMTMNFYIGSELISELEVGQKIQFTLSKRGNSYEITEFSVVGEGAGRSGTTQTLALADDPAPAFRLTDQSGAPLALADLRGKAVLLDFIFTNCGGPCPILTGVKAEVQRALAPSLAARSHFVSITLDPLRDTPEVLRAYAQERRLDLTNWSFLTGTPELIDATLRAYGVGAVPVDGGDIQHTLATFLIAPDGQIARRYLGTGTEALELQADLEALL